jgi:hypothetical protein
MAKETIRIFIVITLSLAAISSGWARPMVVTREEPEHVDLEVPDSWTISEEAPGTDFLTHSMVAVSPEGDQKVSVGWLSDGDVPMRVNNDVIESFRGNIRNWLTAHQVTGEVKPSHNTNLMEPAKCLGQLVIGSDDKQTEVDYYMLLGRNAAYIISYTHPSDAQLIDFECSLESPSESVNFRSSASDIDVNSDENEPRPAPQPTRSSGGGATRYGLTGGGGLFVIILIIRIAMRLIRSAR